MSSVSVRLDDETDQLLQRLKDMSDIDKAGMMNAIAEGLRTSTLERFRTEKNGSVPYVPRKVEERH